MKQVFVDKTGTSFDTKISSLDVTSNKVTLSKTSSIVFLTSFNSTNSIETVINKT
uniref:Uncharacterized protein n=1 Tax=Solanum lycopersicum TaxID=4081 RepID=A0A3Q7J4P3_SOLLC